jgi:hypothetical protein
MPPVPKTYGHKKPKYFKVLSDEALNLVRLTTRPVLVYRDEKAAWKFKVELVAKIF